MSVSLSSEQLEVVTAVNNHNVIVDSVAGSGKSTTAISIVKKYPKKSFLLLTYNSRLRLETRQRVSSMDLKNVDVHTYHSFGYGYYKKGCHVDKDIMSIVERNSKPQKPFGYDVVIIDEAQDMSSLYYHFATKIMTDSRKSHPQVCIFGDVNQSIFKFNEADERFIKYADLLFKQVASPLPWKRLSISISYRITHPMANFLNKCALGYERIQASKDGDNVKYIVANCFGDRPYQEIKSILKKYNYQDIFVLAPSVKSEKSPTRKLANKLSTTDKIPIFVPNNDDDKLDLELLKDKLVFSTYHQVKGLERKVVVVMNCDDSYYKWFGKNETQDVCPNIFYVAFTRAKEQLVIFHHQTEQYLPFINTKELLFQADVENYKVPVRREITATESKKFYVTELTKHLPSRVIAEAMKFLTKKSLNTKGEYIDIPTKVQGDTTESVAEITGTALVAFYEKKTQGEMTIANALRAGHTAKEIPEVLKLANEYCASVSGYVYKLNQIQKYDWLDKSNLKRCLRRLGRKIGDRGTKYELELSGEVGIGDKTIIGRADCVTSSTDGEGGTLWEFKCTSEVDDTHFIQLALYAYLWESDHLFDRKGKYKYRLYNILTDELFSLKFDYEELEEMVKFLVLQKIGKNEGGDDDETFIRKMLE